MSHFSKANAANRAEINRLRQRQTNMIRIIQLGNNTNKWAELSLNNRHRLHLLRLEINRGEFPRLDTAINSIQYKIKKLIDKIATRRFLYGYNRPSNRTYVRLYNNNFVKEGTIRPLPFYHHKRPANAKPANAKPAKRPPRGYLPTLKELAYAAAPELAPLRRMNNEQLALVRNNLRLLVPKRRATPLSNANYAELRRQLAAFKIQRAWKKRSPKSSAWKNNTTLTNEAKKLFNNRERQFRANQQAARVVREARRLEKLRPLSWRKPA